MLYWTVKRSTKIKEMDTSYENLKHRRLLGAVILLFWASQYAYVPYFTPYMKELGFSASLIGVLSAAYGFTQLVVRVPLGIGTDMTCGYRQVVILGTFLVTAAGAGLFLSSSAGLILVFRLFSGLAASTWLSFTVLYAACFGPGENLKAMTDANILNNAGKLAAYAAGMALCALFGYRYSFLISIVAGAASLALALQLKDLPVSREPVTLKKLGTVFRDPAVLVSSFFAALLNMTLQATTFSFTSTAAASLGAGSLELGISTALYTVVQVFFGSVISRRITQRLPRKWAVFTGFGFISLACLLTALGRNMLFIYASQMLMGAGNIILISLLMALAISSVPVECRSSAMGLFQALYAIGMTLGPIWMGNIAETRSVSAGFLLFAAVCAASMLAALFLIPWMERKENL